jgi:Mrp family chromosome partitioning ATPase
LLAIQSSEVQGDLARAQQELKEYRLGHAAAPGIAALEWQVTSLAQQYDALQRRRQALAEKGRIVQPEVRLLALASPPERPSTLHPLSLIPPAVITFILLGCFLAVVFNRLDRTLYTEAEAAEALGIPCDGLIPSISPDRNQQLQHLVQRPASHYSRAIRSILTTTLPARPAASRLYRIVLVSSSLPGEGKSTLAWSLAACAAQLPWRTLLMDFSRLAHPRGEQHANLPGALANESSLLGAIEHVSEIGIDYLPMLRSGGSLLSLLASAEALPLLRQMGETYDFVIVDGPSLLEAPEAKLLAALANHILLAIRCGSTNREAAQNMLRQLARTEHLNQAEIVRFSSVLTRSGPPHGSDIAHGTDQHRKPRTLVVSSQRAKAQFVDAPRRTTKLEALRAALATVRLRRWFASD